jgi:hypothetical protein
MMQEGKLYHLGRKIIEALSRTDRKSTASTFRHVRKRRWSWGIPAVQR